MPEMTVTHHPGEFVAKLQGETAVGRLTYVTHGSVLVAEHTLVPPAIGGRGVAAKLVEALVAYAVDMDMKIDPQCSYVDAAFRRHPEWAHLLICRPQDN